MKCYATLPAVVWLAIASYPSISEAANIQTSSCIVEGINVSTANAQYDQPRLTIVCQNAPNGISYFAYLASNNPTVFQALATTISAAQVANQITIQLKNYNNAVLIKYDLDDKSGNDWGCGGANCRMILSLQVI
jgi:FlaG/FlaF family flagellin (archaellin)